MTLLEEPREAADARPTVPGALLVETIGNRSLDHYARELAARLDVELVRTDIYERSAELFGARLLGRASLAALGADVGFLRELRARDADIVHLPNHHLGRYGLALGKPYLVTVHDTIRLLDLAGGETLIHRPNLRDRLVLRADYGGVARATAVIAVSEATKRDVVLHLGVDPDRIHVVHEGVDRARFYPVRERLLDDAYVLYVGSEHPRKNVPRLLAAFARLKREPRFRSLKLVKVGSAGGPEAPFRAQTEAAIDDVGIARDVVFPGRVGEAELRAWYSGAECFVLASLYEGFGLPVLEAMACGCPVVVSSAAALPETAGGAALVVPPRDVDAIAAAIRRVLVEGDLRRELRRLGDVRASELSWERTAAETARVYEHVLGVLAEERRVPAPRATERREQWLPRS